MKSGAEGGVNLSIGSNMMIPILDGSESNNDLANNTASVMCKLPGRNINARSVRESQVIHAGT